MYRKMLFTIVLLSTTQAFGFDFMGPSSSKLTASDKSSAAIEYFECELEIKADGIPEIGLTSATIKDVEFDKVSANFALGMGRGSEIFLRLGVADAEPDEEENWDNVAGYVGSSDDNFIIGGGAKWTLAKSQNFSWGLLTQVSWTNLDFDEKRYSIGGYSVNFSTEVEIVEFQIATGPTFDLTENVSFYGGPFLYFLSGDADLDGTIDGLAGSVTTDLEQESILGGYIGTEIRLGQNIAIGIEFQTISGSRGFGGQLAWRF